MKSDSDHKAGLSREMWLGLAMSAMTKSCASKFSLDSLLKEMPVSKGSFYWHFKNRAEFLSALVEYWGRHDTRLPADALDKLPQTVSAEDKLWELMCMVYELKHTRHDLLIRSLTSEFPELHRAVAQVDQMRYQTVRTLFAEMGFEDSELDMRTLAFITTTSLDRLMLVDIPDDAYERQLKLRHAFFIRP